MSYTPTEWKTGDVITAEKLNNMESGIVGAGGVLVLNVGQSNMALDKKCSEIKNAIAAGKTLMCRIAQTGEEGTGYTFLSVVTCDIYTRGGCSVELYLKGDEPAYFDAKTDNDYPTYSAGNRPAPTPTASTAT